MATPKFTSHTTCINEFPKSDRTDLVSYEEDDPDTIRVLPRNDLKRRRCDSGVHFDESFERVLSNPTGLQEKTGAAAETGIKCLQFASGIMPVMSSPSADADSGRRLCKAINQPLTEADQMVLVPLATLKALQNEITELRNAFGFFKEDSRKFVSHDALNARLALIEVRTESSDGDDDDEDDDYCSPQALQKDKAARKVAVERIRRLAKHHNGKERAHLKFMADIVGVKHTSKVGNRLVHMVHLRKG